jgi:outer membrane protein assembly factor BamB
VAGVGALGAAAVAAWLGGPPAAGGKWWPSPAASALRERLPGETVRLDLGRRGPETRPANTGTLIAGPGRAADLPGDWPGFRGLNRDNILPSAGPLLRTWPEEGPKVLWRVPTGEGHAGAAVHRGRVYLIDYDQEKKEDAIRCLSLADGQEIWRYTYSVHVKRNHGMSRTVPAVTDDYVVSIGPLGHVTCLNAATGALVWKFDLVREFQTEVPPWYAGQCALIDGGAAILAPGGDPLIMAVDLATGAVRWRTPNPGGHGMTHSSIMPFDAPGGRQYVYCSTRGVVGVSATDGRLLWLYPDWKISIANVPSPVVVSGERLFLSGGYDAGCLMLGLIPAPAPLWRLKASVFGSPQHTPILWQDHLYGVIPNGELACLDLSGKVRWTSGPQRRFGLGPFLLADGMLYVLNDQSGTLYLVSADPTVYVEHAAAKVLKGHDAWAPMALAGGRLILRDLTELACLDVGGT